MENRDNNADIWFVVIGVIALVFMFYFFFRQTTVRTSPVISPVYVPQTSTTNTDKTTIKEILVTPTSVASPTATPTKVIN